MPPDRSTPTCARHVVIAAGLTLLTGWLTPVAARAQPAPCSLLPGRPESPPTEQTAAGARYCQGQYWLRVDASQRQRAGITLNITLWPTEAEAVKRAQSAAPPGYRAVDYGNGGYEQPEDASRFSSSGTYGAGVLTGERPTGYYQVLFRCGAYSVTGSAEPPKAIEARRMLDELNNRLKAESLCGPPSTTDATAPAAPARPTPTTMVPPSIGGARRVFSVGGDCVRDGQGLLCTAAASNPPDNVPLEQVRFMWSLDGAIQGARSGTLRLPVLPAGGHVVTVRAFTPSSIYTDTFTIQVR